MAANDLIGPQAVPLKSREVTIPEQSPQLAQVKEATGGLEESIGKLLRSTANQESYNQDADAFINAKTQINELNRNLVGIRDFDQKIKALQTGIQAIKDNVSKEPGLKPTTVKNIIGAIDNDYTELYKGAVADRRINGEKDFKSALKGLKELATKSTSDTERNSIDVQAHTLINSALANGYISKTDADYGKWKFHYDVNLDHWKQYFAENPEKFATVPFAKMGVNWDDWKILQRDAYNQVERQLNVFNLTVKKDQYNAENELSLHPELLTDPGRYATMLRSRASPSFLNDKIPPASSSEVDDMIFHRIKGTKWDTVDELDNYYLGTASKVKMLPIDRERLNKAFSEERSTLGSNLGKYIHDHQQKLKALLDTLHKIPRYVPPGMKDVNTQFIKIIGHAIDDIPYTSTDTEDVDKKYNAIKETLENHDFKTGKDNTLSVSKPASSATPSATPTPTITSRSDVPSDGHDDSGGLPWEANSVFDRLSQAESGTWGKPLSGRNIIESWLSDPFTPEEARSQGYFGIKSETGHEFARLAGIEGFTRAMNLSAAEQESLVALMPFRDFGPRTQKLMEGVYGHIDPDMTIGEMAAKFG